MEINKAVEVVSTFDLKCMELLKDTMCIQEKLDAIDVILTACQERLDGPITTLEEDYMARRKKRVLIRDKRTGARYLAYE